MGIKIEQTSEEQISLLMGMVLDLQAEIAKRFREINEQTDKRIDAILESKIPVIDGRLALRDIVKLRELLIEKGLISEAEFIAKLKE